MSERAKFIAYVAIAALALARPAFSFGLGHLSAGFGAMGAQGSGGPVAPPPTGALMLEDGVTPITLEDGTTPLCLEGGC